MAQNRALSITKNILTRLTTKNPITEVYPAQTALRYALQGLFTDAVVEKFLCFAHCHGLAEYANDAIAQALTLWVFDQALRAGLTISMTPNFLEMMAAFRNDQYQNPDQHQMALIADAKKESRVAFYTGFSALMLTMLCAQLFCEHDTTQNDTNKMNHLNQLCAWIYLCTAYGSKFLIQELGLFTLFNQPANQQPFSANLENLNEEGYQSAPAQP